MKKSLILIILIAAVSVSTTAKELFPSVSNSSLRQKLENGIEKSRSTIDWIYTDDHARRPSGNLGLYYGNRLMFYHWPSNPANGADRSFGYFLQYTYDMYCSLKSRSNYCLGSSLITYYKAKGQYHGNTVYYVNVDGTSRVTKSLREITLFYLQRLEQKGGYLAERNNIYLSLTKRYTPVYTTVTRTDTRKGNELWIKNKYRQLVLDRASQLTGYTFNFADRGQDEINSNKFYTGDQYLLLANTYGKRKYNKITAIISGPNTPRTAGLAYVGYDNAPFFIMRSRYSPSSMWSAVAIDNNARIFLHELGHAALARPHVATINADNWYSRTDGRNLARIHLNSMSNQYNSFIY